VSELVLVTGASGKTGRHLLHELDARGIPARPATRHSTIPLDWEDPTTWEPALDGVTSAYLVAPATVPDPYGAVIDFLELATARGISRLVFLSMSSIPPGDLAHGRVHRWLIENADDFAVLRPSVFLQNFSEGPFSASIATEGAIYSNTGDGRVSFIDAADIAAVAACVLAAPGTLADDLVLTGPHACSFDDVASAIGAALGRRIEHRRVSDEDLAARFEQHGIPASTAFLLALAYSTIAGGGEDFTTDVVMSFTGRPPTSVATFAARHVSSWQGGTSGDAAEDR
jgi:uncharacterized protein YbjT (DUF2867 family)